MGGGQWPVKNHEVTDASGDVFDGNGALVACPSMDVLNTSEQRSGDIVTVTMTLGAPPSFLAAAGCSHSGAAGGLWGAEWWSASAPDPDTGGGPNDNFYLAFRDNPAAGGTGVEAGRMNNFTLTFTGEEFHPIEPGTLGGTCAGTAPPSPCTIVMSASLSGLGIKSGAGLQGITGLSVYYYGSEQRPPLFPVPIGFSQQADAAAPFDQEGTGTLP